MANPYDDIVGSWQQETNRAPLTTAPNPYDAVVGEIANERQTRTRAIFEKALAVNPDQAAETQKLTRTTGLPFSVIDRNFTEAKRREQARMLDLARLSQDSPILARQLLDPTFTSQTHDHLDNLSTIEQTFNVVRAVPAGAARGVGTLLSGSGQLIDIGARNIGLTAVSRAVRDLTGADPGIALDVAGSLKFAGSGWKMLADAIGPDKEAQNFATDVAGGIGQLIQQIGVQIATGGMSSLFSLFAQGADVMADKTQGDKASQAMRDTAVLTGASITALTEKYGVDALLNRVPPAIKNSALRWIADKLVAGGIEATQEITEGVLQDVVRKLLTNPNATIGDGSLYEASVAGTSAAIVRAALGVRTRGAQEVQKGQQAERDADNLKAQFDLAAQALLRERNPDEFRTLVQTMADNTEGAPKEIYVDAEVLNQLAPEVLNQLPQSVRDALPDALAANDVVAISTGDVLTIAPGTPLEQVLIENARIGDPMAMSQKEAKDAGSKAQEFLAQEAERVIQQASDQQAMQASSDRVKQGVLDQLNTVGRFRKEVNEGYATWTAAFYTTMAGRTGMTPEQMAAKYPLRVVGQSGQGETLKAGKVGEITVEGFNFGKSNRTTLSGSNFGRGLAGNNRDLYLNAADKRLSKRIYFYVDKGTGITPEAGVGGIARKFNLTNVYDGDTDPLRLKTGRDQLGFESAVLDAGFSGYLTRMEGTQSGQVILLGDQTVTGELLGPTTRTTGKVVPEKGTREARGRDVIVDALNADKTLPSGSPTLARWQELLAKNPEVLQALTDAGVFAGDLTQTAFKSELIKAYQGATPAESYAQKAETSNVKLPKKQTATTAVDIRKGGRLTGDQAMDIHQVAAYFDKIAGGPSDFNDPKAQAKALKTIVAELEYQLSLEKSGLDWYEEDIKTSFELTQKVIPELADPRQRMLFSVVAGLQSPGTNARDNWAIAAEAFQHYKATGAIPGRNPKTGGLWQGGPVSANKEKALDFLNNMVQDLGESATIDWLMGQHTVKELNAARKQWGNMGPGVTGKATDTAMGVVAFGPKVGPFVMNINGIHEITVDVWATRSFNRYFGTMLGPDGKITDAPTEPQRRVAKELFNAAAEKVGIKAYQVQSVLWFFEQQLFNHLGTGTPSYGFSDGARKFARANGVDTGAVEGLPVSERDAQAAAGEVNGRLEQAGDGSGRPAGGNLAPLEGAPSVPGFQGPDPRIVAVAEQYARDNGIDLKRQAEYVRVDPERATRIAAAYEAMQHNPQDPAVKEAYDNLIKQTLAQYQALEKAGYKFWFIDFNQPSNVDYVSSPWNAMRDMRANQQMGVFPTNDGFGSGDFSPEANPLLADTGLQWPVGGPDGPLQPVLANDLFRAVHDAFGHGMEGAGFRADGEENAWQAHSRLFTGSAVGAITSETRGQNSWLNYGPNGESNRTAKVEDTVFADQKTGLMPEWTWSEGRAGDQSEVLNQADLFPGEFADKTTTVNTDIVVSSKGETLQGGNVNSAGQQITATKQGLQNFWKWFGQSEAVDDNDNPLVLYHSTNADTNVLTAGRETTNSYGILGEVTTSRAGVFLTPDREFSQEYLRAGGGQNVMPVYLSVQQPFDLRNGLTEQMEQELEAAGMNTRFILNAQTYWELFDNADDGTNDFVSGLKKLGYDGAIFAEDSPSGDTAGGTTFVAFDSAQIKSAIGNQGTFDTQDPNILRQGPRGTFSPKNLELALNENADLSTFLHETGHFFLEVMADLASQPGAPADIATDMAALLKWFGVADLATWNALPLDGKRPYHERFAESFEQYLLEGKAPSVELQPLFRKFRAWMLNVYKSLKAFVDGRTGETQIQLSPEIRQVFDRMLASEAQIAEANEVAGLLPNEEADAEANERLTARSLRDLKWTVNARAREIKKLQDQAKEQRKEVEAEVTLEVNAMPEFQAQAALAALQVNPDYTVALKLWNEQRAAALTAASEQIKADLLAANPDVKGLQKGQLLTKNKKVMANQAEAKALEWEAQNPKPRKADNASDADLAVIADSFNYPDADTMLQAIDAVGKKADVIEGMTDQRMLEQYGDLIDQRAIEAAANEAVHNEARARSLATELRSQAEMLNPRTDTGQVNAQGSRITVNALVEAAKQFAANVISRTPLRDLKAKAWQHTAAERRAGKRWAEATAKGETQEAVKAKQDQMLNNAAAKAAIDAQAEMRKYLTFFKRVIKDNNEKVVEKGRDPDVVNAARAVLAAYGVAPKAGKTALEYLALVEKNDPAMFAALQPSVQGALNLAQPLDALTMDELRGLHEEIQAMWHLAKRSRQMEVDGNLLDIEDAETELQDRMQEIGVPDTMPGDTGAVTPREELARKLQYAGSILRRVEQWAQGMGGAFTKLVFQPVKEAADRYRADRVVYRKRYQALVDAVAPALTKGLIAAPELDYTFGKGHNGIGHAELLHAILHTGNSSNKRKLLLGRNWATENADGTLNTDRWDAFLQRMHDTGVLTKAHYDFAQGVWDLLEQTKPLAQKTHRDVFGRYFAEVTADSFDTPFGSYAGGYVPAQADPRIVQDADLRALATLENENMSFSFPGTNKGFTKSRVEYNRPLMLDLRTIGQHLDKVLLFSYMEPAVRDVNKLLSRKGVSYSLGRIDPTVYAGMLTPWLKRSATQVVETPEVADGGISRMMSAARSRAGMALMFANVSNTLQQLTGFSVAAIKVKPASMMRATATFIASPKQTAKAVADASVFMANRMENEIAAINDAMDAILLDPSLYEKSQAWTQKHAYFLQTAMANTMEPIIWTAAYNDAITRGDSDRDAVRHADSVIRTTQGSTLPEDVSRLETGRAWARLFTQFIGYFNMLANTNATALLQVSREMGLKKGAGKALGIITLGMLAPIWVAEAIAHAMRGGPEDEDKDGYLDDWLMAVFGMGTIKGTFAMVPFLGQAAQLTVNKFNDNPADDKFSLSPAVSLIESTVSAPFSVYKAIAEDGNRQKAVRDVASAVSIATGLPAFAVARPLGYLAGVEQGKVEPTDALDLARGLVSGTASPASK